ncbi:MAG: M23 family metallopeptidase [Candidatus Sungbacteria bacterium]|uniref:M23 family metallopeptidase n=1 Tax=Candidatus Sungiibacteriota bacterium TaxID=2750080 RepID=A0A9D6LS83_9BACT|nr:M23 family metallopeptidase [Candidatus Sungbacteria bacterium]
MQWNGDVNPNTGLPINKYHDGEDWNGKCGGDTDLGAPLYAIGTTGQVVYLDRSAPQGYGNRLYIRYSIAYSKGTNGVLTFDMGYLHLQDIVPSINWDPNTPGSGSFVTSGQLVAHLGGTGGWVPHLHWEADATNLPINTNQYQNPLYLSTALSYRSPSLITDDRRDQKGYVFPTTYYGTFTMSGNAPSSLAYVEYNGEKKSLKNAVAAGWIPAWAINFYDTSSGKWYYYTNVDDNFFQNGKQYAIIANVSNAVFRFFVPRNSFQPDRARLDMLKAASKDSRVSSILTETYSQNPNWDTNWVLYSLSFLLTDSRTMAFYQVTSKSNPLTRYTGFYDPNTGAWSGWVWTDWNALY